MNNIVLNRAKCKKCGDVITSYHRHDYVSCKCASIAVDGGTEYRRRTGDLENIIDMSVDSSAPYEVIRESFHRGGRGINGDQPLTWVPLSKMNDEWVAACITYNEELGLGKSFASQMYAKELEYRKTNNIKVV